MAREYQTIKIAAIVFSFLPLVFELYTGVDWEDNIKLHFQELGWGHKLVTHIEGGM